MLLTIKSGFMKVIRFKDRRFLNLWYQYQDDTFHSEVDIPKKNWILNGSTPLGMLQNAHHTFFYPQEQAKLQLAQSYGWRTETSLLFKNPYYWLKDWTEISLFVPSELLLIENVCRKNKNNNNLNLNNFIERLYA